KAEREGADRLQQEIETMLWLARDAGKWEPPVIRTTATEGKGIDNLIEAIEKFRLEIRNSPERNNRDVQHWEQRLHALLGEYLLDRIMAKNGGKSALESLARDVAERRVNPYTAVREMAARIGV